MKSIKACLVLALVLFLRTSSYAETLKVKVTGVVEGDVITVLLRDGAQQQVRLLGIDAPEMEQNFGPAARQHLASLLADKPVNIEYVKQDSDGRILGKVWLNGKDICLEMLRVGLAWFNKEHADALIPGNRELYLTAEAEALRNHKGLWVEPSPQPPWIYAKRKTIEMQNGGRSISISGSAVFSGRVAEILGGASIALMRTDDSRTVICINNLEVPEPGQPYADVARQHLQDFLKGRAVTVRLRGFYEDSACLIGDVYLGDVNITLQMVRDGVAWCNSDYFYPEGYYVYERAEQAARSERRGIWQDASPIPPWIHRGERGDIRGYGIESGGGYVYGGVTSSGAGKDVPVRGYYRRDGTYVRPHTRSAPGRGVGRIGSSGGRRGGRYE
jgi:micrococcal nuclease